MLEDVHNASLLVLAGQNPGTNHPRMLSALEEAKRRGAKILAINPLREAGLMGFKNPQRPGGWVGPGTDLADLHLPIRVNGDLALFQAFGALLLDWDALDHDFIAEHTIGFPAWRDHLQRLDWDQVLASHGAGAEPDRRGRRDAARLRRHRLLLGHGSHPAPERRGHHQGDRQPRLRAGQHRQAGRRTAARTRALQRAGRPDHGDLGAAAGALPRRPPGGVRLRPAAGARLRHRRRHPGHAGRPRPRLHRAGRQLRAGRARHRRSPPTPCAGPG